MYYKENFAANFLYIVIGIAEEYKKTKNDRLFYNSLKKARSEFHALTHDIAALDLSFDLFIANRLKGLKSDIEDIKKKIKINESANDRCSKFFSSYTEDLVSNDIKIYQTCYYNLFENDYNAENLKDNALDLLDLNRKIEKFCEKLNDLEVTLIKYNQQIWNALLTDIDNYNTGDKYNLLVHRTVGSIDELKKCNSIQEWIEDDNGFICASYINDKFPNIYKKKESYIAGYGFVLKMDTNKLASISRKDNFTNYSFAGQGISEYRKNPFNYFKSLITNVSLSSPLDTSITKIPEKLLNSCGLYNEFVFDFTKNGADLVIGIFCMVDNNFVKKEEDSQFIQEFESIADKLRLKFIVLQA